MSRLDKNNIKKSAKTNNFSLLNQAEIALAVGAFFGFLAVLSLVLLPWSLALFAAGITMVALVVAVVILSIPPYPIASLKMKSEEENPKLPKNQGGGSKSSDFTLSTRQILESTVSHKKNDTTRIEIEHFSSPLSSSTPIIFDCVIPAKAGNHLPDQNNVLLSLDPPLRGDPSFLS